MKRDTIFYQIFQQSPNLLFDLLPESIAPKEGYTFDSVEVKETSFRIDGVLTPPDASGDVFFIEVQMQLDPKLYDRMHSEIGIYSYRYPERFEEWRAVAIYPNRNVEQSHTKVPKELFDSGRIRSVYLNELGAITDLSPGLGLMVLTTLEGEEAIDGAKGIVARSRQTIDESVIIGMVSTILVYKFKTFSRDEVNAMLGYELKELGETRYFQEVRQEAREEGREEGYREFVLTLLDRKVGQLSSPIREKIEALKLDRLQGLSTDLLDFTSLADLENWLLSH
jgi:predicted transposase/invertase (TIGR01784 family)